MNSKLNKLYWKLTPRSFFFVDRLNDSLPSPEHSDWSPSSMTTTSDRFNLESAFRMFTSPLFWGVGGPNFPCEKSFETLESGQLSTEVDFCIPAFSSEDTRLFSIQPLLTDLDNILYIFRIFSHSILVELQEISRHNRQFKREKTNTSTPWNIWEMF